MCVEVAVLVPEVEAVDAGVAVHPVGGVTTGGVWSVQEVSSSRNGVACASVAIQSV